MKQLLFAALIMVLTTTHWASAGSPATMQPEPTDTLLMGDAEAGQALHAKSCTVCHISMFGGDGSVIYTRQNRKIKTVEGLMARVERCNKNVGSHFDKAQIDDVVKYLSAEFYKFAAAKESKMDTHIMVKPEKDDPKMDAPKK